MHKFILFILFLSFVSLSIANAKHDGQILQKMDYALKQCLDNNYTASGAYKRSDLNDFSYHPEHTTIPINQRWQLNDFVSTETDHFYTEQEMIHLETSGDRIGNHIFEKCMSFYHSEKLKKFVQALKE